jgi:hypothetical protein
VAPKTRIQADCTIQEAKLQVPDVIKFKSKYGEPPLGLKGVWNGVTVGTVNCEYVE